MKIKIYKQKKREIKNGGSAVPNKKHGKQSCTLCIIKKSIKCGEVKLFMYMYKVRPTTQNC